MILGQHFATCFIYFNKHLLTAFIVFFFVNI